MNPLYLMFYMKEYMVLDKITSSLNFLDVWLPEVDQVPHVIFETRS